MKAGSIFRRNGETGLVVETAHGLLDVTRASQEQQHAVPLNMESLVEGGSEAMGALQALAQSFEHRDDDNYYLGQEDFTWAPVLQNPEKIICVGLNYRKHAAETGNAIPERPILFNKFSNALAGNRSEVPIPAETLELDYEAELAIVIGREARFVSEENALDYVFGYAVANDISARDLQRATSQWMLGKTSNRFLPIGPYITTSDSIVNPNQLRITCRRNGVIVQDSNTADMIFDCKQIISYISRFFTLKPGDIILTGTPEGVIMGAPRDEQVWLQPQEQIATEIEGLGLLEFTIGGKERANK